MRANPGGNGAVLTAGTLGGREGVTAPGACRPAAAVEPLSEPAEGLESGGGPEAAAGMAASGVGWPSTPSAGAEPFLDGAEEIFQISRY